MRVIRRRLGLTELQLAREIGYTGTDRNDDTRIREYERGKKQIPLYIARLVWLLGCLRQEVESDPPELWPSVVSEDGKVDWPEWPGYEFEHIPDTQTSR